MFLFNGLDIHIFYSSCWQFIVFILFIPIWWSWLMVLIFLRFRFHDVTTLALGSWPRQRLAKVWAKKGSLGITSHVRRNVGKCKGMNTHTPKWAPILEVGVSVDSQIFKERLHESKPIGLKSFLYHWKDLET
jgi:hypothetical protein